MTAAFSVDVIIPVYNALADLRACVASVLAHTENYRLLLIDDASPDPGIQAYFAELAADLPAHMQLLSNPQNLGFVGTVNRGMALSQNDVVLLNSDTLVTPGWLNKMRRAAQSDARIATLTPFSNNAEICSFPRFCADNGWRADQDAQQINAAIEQAAVPCYPDIPTAVGFCMYIRRAALNDVGLFDAELFRLGYGEENDFCMRVQARGWRNVLVDDTFVVHTGSKSFSEKKQALVETNLQKLLQRHPHYLQQVMQFIEADPIRPMRTWAQTQWALTQAPRRPGVLHVLHARGGGTLRQVQDLILAQQPTLRGYAVQVDGDSWQVTDWEDPEQPRQYQLTRADNEPWADFLRGICASLHIDWVHLHHLVGAREGLLTALSQAGWPYVVTVHDFHLACPTINLLNAQGLFCGGETETLRCQNCLQAQPAFSQADIGRWRSEHAALLAQAHAVIVPSASTRTLLQRYFPALDQVHVVAHGAAAPVAANGACQALLLPHDDLPTVAVIGAIGPVKGARLLEQLVAQSRSEHWPWRWVILGYTDTQSGPWQAADQRLTVHGAYQNAQLPALLQHYRAQVVLFPSAGPETFCYTLSEAWQAGLPVVVPPFGALAERVQASGAGWILPEMSVNSVRAQLQQLLHDDPAERQRKQQAARAYQAPGLATMAAQTQAAYPAPTAHPQVRPLASARWVQASAQAQPPAPPVQGWRRWLRRLLGPLLRWLSRYRHHALLRWWHQRLPLALKQRLRRWMVR